MRFESEDLDKLRRRKRAVDAEIARLEELGEPGDRKIIRELKVQAVRIQEELERRDLAEELERQADS